ncbi:MAG: nitroreductase family protein [candidate division Zixibacteria bacterium]|nr:nitroreductase family protein [candidate division Zixibacteria bacterium]
MDFFEVVKNRHSIRAFKNKEIEKEKLDKLLFVANSSPSAGDLQAYQIFLVRENAQKIALAKAAYGQDFIAQASVDLVFCTDPLRSARKYGRRGSELYSIQDATISAAYVHLAAVDLGLGSVIVGAFDEEAVSKILNLPGTLRPIIILPVGYPDEEPETTPRRKIDDLVKEVE